MHLHMQVNMHVHFDHNNDGLFSQVARELANAIDWVTGPALPEQQKRDLTLAEAQNRKFSDLVV